MGGCDSTGGDCYINKSNGSLNDRLCANDTWVHNGHMCKTFGDASSAVFTATDPIAPY